MIAKVTLTFLTKDTDGELLVESGRILDSMTGNAAFATPVPTLANIETAREAFEEAANGMDGRASSTVLRDQTRKALTDLLRSLGGYVQLTANGDLLALLSSGFLAQKGRQPVGPLPRPQNMRLIRTEQTGQLLARCNKVPKATGYQWRRAAASAPGNWTVLDPTTAARVLLEDLTPGTIYIVECRAIGSAGPSDWSDPAELMAV